jgi:hypothetical protein
MAVTVKTVKIAPRICKRCGQQYQPTARCQKYCGKQKERGSCSWHMGQTITKRWLKDNTQKKAEYYDRWWNKLVKDPERYEKYLSRSRQKDLKRHGLTQVQYDAKFAEQHGLCAICLQPHGRSLLGRSKQLAVDHDHATGALRGLLCDDCNLGLGLFLDDPQRLMNAAVYILRYKDTLNIPTMLATQRRMSSGQLEDSVEYIDGQPLQ